MWKRVIGYFAASLFGAIVGSAGIVLSASIPLFNPQQLQIPATGADLNNLVGQINSTTILGGPGGTSGAPGSSSGSFSVSQTPPAGGTVVDGIQVVGAAKGGFPAAGFGNGPTIRGVGSDTNVNLGLVPQGAGYVQFANPTSWVHQASLTQCPGLGIASVPTGGSSQNLTPAQTVTGYVWILDDQGKGHGIPVC